MAWILIKYLTGQLRHDPLGAGPAPHAHSAVDDIELFARSGLMQCQPLAGVSEIQLNAVPEVGGGGKVEFALGIDAGGPAAGLHPTAQLRHQPIHRARRPHQPIALIFPLVQ
jgi:hypothetical protein